jgi:trans-2-enoyl-CoA reductase
MIEQVDVKSVRFHFLRKDFEKWVEEVLEDDVLAKKIKTLRNSFLEEDVLKQRLQSTLTERYSELRESV